MPIGYTYYSEKVLTLTLWRKRRRQSLFSIAFRYTLLSIFSEMLLVAVHKGDIHEQQPAADRSQIQQIAFSYMNIATLPPSTIISLWTTIPDLILMALLFDFLLLLLLFLSPVFIHIYYHFVLIFSLSRVLLSNLKDWDGFYVLRLDALL